MTKRNIVLTLKLTLFALIFMLFCAIQTSFWPFMLGFLPSPQFWLILIIFIAMKWPPTVAIFYIYFLGFILTQYSHLPLKMAWIPLLLVTVFVWLFKNRIHSTSVFYFSILVTSASIFYAISYIGVSYWLEHVPTPIYVLHRLAEIGCNFLVSIPLYKFLNFFDQKFKFTESWGSAKTQPQEPVEL